MRPGFQGAPFFCAPVTAVLAVATRVRVFLVHEVLGHLRLQCALEYPVSQLFDQPDRNDFQESTGVKEGYM